MAMEVWALGVFVVFGMMWLLRKHGIDFHCSLMVKDVAACCLPFASMITLIFRLFLYYITIEF